MNSVKLAHKKHFITIAIAISLATSLHSSAMLIREAAALTSYEVKIADFAFVPQNLTINPGATVTWNNTDPVIHTLWFVYIANGSTYLLSSPIPPDTTWTYTFNDTVELQYYSFDKLWITGFINVKVVSGVHDVAVVNVKALKTIVCQGFKMRINVTVENQGESTETFDVTLYANTTTIQTSAVTSLAPTIQTTITFTWNTTGFLKGKYTIRAYAHQVPGETDLADNTFTDDTVAVTMVGDINDDGKVDMKDIGAAAKAFGSYPGHERWNSEADIDDNEKVDMKDIGRIAKEFGKIDP